MTGIRQLAFVGLLATEVYGFFSRHLFAQAIWTELGIRHLLLFVSACTIAAAAIYFWRPSWLAPLAWGVAILYTVGVVGFEGPAAVACFLFAAFVLGRAIGEPADDLLALLAGICAYIALVGISACFRINYSAVYLLLLALPLVCRYYDVGECARRAARLFRPVAVTSLAQYAALALVIFILLAHWLVVLKPETSTDGLAMHLAIPAAVAAHHIWDFDFRRVVWAVMPMGGDWAYTMAYMLGGEYAARLLNLSALGLTTALLFSTIRRFASLTLALLTTAAFASSPLVQLETGSLFIENLWSVMLLGALISLWRYREQSSPRYAFLTAAFLGSAMSMKLGSVAFVVPLACLAAVECVRLARRRQLRTSTVILCLLCFLVLAVPPYVNAYVRTGNPVFPYLNATFHSPFYDSSVNWKEFRFGEPLRWDTLFSITFASHKYFEGQDGGFAFQYLLLLPLCILFVRRDWPYPAWAALVVCLAGFVLTFRAQAYLRYIYPLLPMATISIACSVAQAQMEDRRLFRGLCAATLAATALNIYFLAASGWYQKDFYLNALFGKGDVERYIRQSCPARRLIEFLNLTAPDAPVAFLTGNQIAGLRGRAYTHTWHGGEFNRLLDEASSPAQVLQLMQSLGIGFFVAPAPENRWDKMAPVIWAFLGEFTEPQYTYGDYYVARLKRSARQESGTVVDDSNGEIEYLGGDWIRAKPAEAAGGTLSYSDRPGAEFRFSFTGKQVTFVYRKAPDGGQAAVTIDDTPRGVVEEYSPATEWDARLTFGSLSPGRHTIVVRVLPDKHEASTGNSVSVDKLIVEP